VWPAVSPLDGYAPRVGVIVTIYNKADRFSHCLRTLLERTQYPRFTTYVVDDGSDEHSQSRIAEIVSGAPDVHIVRHQNKGYLGSANHGAYRAIHDGCDVLVFVNSDVRLTYGWLSAMVRAHLRTGADMVNPLSNQQGPISLPLALEKSWGFPRLRGGIGYRDAAMAASFLPPRYPDAVTNVGQCMLVTASAWEAHGPFDAETYGTGYGEECELWAKVVEGGGTCVVADDAYVFHEGHGTHENASAREREGAETFIARWGHVYKPRALEIRRWPQRTASVRVFTNGLKQPGCPVRFVLMNIGPYGGVYCIMRLIDELRELGVDASAVFTRLQNYESALTVGPEQVADSSALGNLTRDERHRGGFVFATHWFTGELLQTMYNRCDDFIPAAFWQDREDLFTNPNGRKSVRDASVQAYTKIPHRIVNARWVGESAKADHGIDRFTHIPVGVDCDKFYPLSATARASGPVRIIAMHRPSTPRRGAERLRRLYLEIKRLHGRRVQFETFGEACQWSDHHYDWLTQDGVAALLRQVDILVEPSEYQGFGLPGLEAMSTGLCVVSSATRGVVEYGRHRENCLIESDAEPLIDLLTEAVDDAGLRKRLGGAGRADALRFNWPGIAERWKQELGRIYRLSGRTLHLSTFD
jgi:GT2 family glycosyltransferase